MAGLLGEIFSAGNVAKRKLTDLLGNPVLAAQQMAGNLNDRARNLNEMTSAAAREGMDYGPASQRLAGLMAEGYNPMGLTVFHGSPAKFNKFDRTKIGSGEGSQQYGYGHYVTESPAIANSYKAMAENPQKRMRVTSKETSDQITKDALIMMNAKQFTGGDTTKLADLIQRRPEAFTDPAGLVKRISEYEGKNVPPSFMYEIDLPDEQIAKMLDFDRPLKDQSPEIQALAKQYGLTDADHMGGDLIAAMGAKKPAGAEMMREAGIPGIKHQQSGREDQPTNFIVFPGNEGLLTIQKRNNEVIEPTSLLGDNPRPFETTTSDASEIFGQGAKRVKYIDPNSGGVIDVLQKPDGTASVLGLEVPEAMRGQGIGQSLQSQVMQDFPEMMGQVSSKAAAKTAYRLGRRPPNAPDATLDDVYKIMDEYSSVNLVSPEMQKRFMQSLLD
jgi:hypothetical protein